MTQVHPAGLSHPAKLISACTLAGLGCSHVRKTWPVLTGMLQGTEQSFVPAAEQDLEDLGVQWSSECPAVLPVIH